VGGMVWLLHPTPINKKTTTIPLLTLRQNRLLLMLTPFYKGGKRLCRPTLD
jgi:hypothetical protein